MANNLIEREELAARWEISVSTLNRWRWNGKGPKFVKIGRKVKYRMHDVEYFENTRLNSSTSSYGRYLIANQEPERPSNKIRRV